MEQCLHLPDQAERGRSQRVAHQRHSAPKEWLEVLLPGLAHYVHDRLFDASLFQVRAAIEASINSGTVRWLSSDAAKDGILGWDFGAHRCCFSIIRIGLMNGAERIEAPVALFQNRQASAASAGLTRERQESFVTKGMKAYVNSRLPVPTHASKPTSPSPVKNEIPSRIPNFGILLNLQSWPA